MVEWKISWIEGFRFVNARPDRVKHLNKNVWSFIRNLQTRCIHVLSISGNPVAMKTSGNGHTCITRVSIPKPNRIATVLLKSFQWNGYHVHNINWNVSRIIYKRACENDLQFHRWQQISSSALVSSAPNHQSIYHTIGNLNSWNQISLTCSLWN